MKSRLVDLNGLPTNEQGAFRKADADLAVIAPVGAVVRTSYGTGPYVVEKITRFSHLEGPETSGPFWCLRVVHVDRYEEPRPFLYEDFSYLNQLVPCGGRICHLFEANGDEVFVIGRVGVLRPEHAQLSLFGQA